MLYHWRIVVSCRLHVIVKEEGNQRLVMYIGEFSLKNLMFLVAIIFVQLNHSVCRDADGLDVFSASNFNECKSFLLQNVRFANKVKLTIQLIRPIGNTESYAIKAFSYYGYHSRSNINCWCMLRCPIQIRWCYCLFINSFHPGRGFSNWPVTNLYLSIDRDAIESMRRDLYHARLIDFDDPELCIGLGVLLSTNYCMLAKVCLSWKGTRLLWNDNKTLRK